MSRDDRFQFFCLGIELEDGQSGSAPAAHRDEKRGGQHPATDYVADHECELSGVELEDVVPVATDLDAGAGRQVLGAEAHAGYLRQRVGQKRALHDGGDGPLLGDSGVVDRERGAIGCQLQQRHVVLVEVALNERADVHDPDDAAFDVERHP